MKTSLANDKVVLKYLVSHENLRKLRLSYDLSLGRPLWWIALKPNGSSKSLKKSIELSHGIWNDARLKKFHGIDAVYRRLKKHSMEIKPYAFNAPKNLQHYCVPLTTQGKTLGNFVLSGVKKDAPHKTLDSLASHLKLLTENCAQKEELERLSATIRPRAIALSTVHTVHRIINSTLNLDELVSRLAHLTAQVLRAHHCAIFLIDKNGSRKKKACLICKSCVGYPKDRNKNTRILWGVGLEGKVAKTAQTVLRKDTICAPLIDEDVMGVIVIAGKKEQGGFTYFDQEILTTLAEEAVIAIKNAELYGEQKKVTLGTIQSLAVILGTRVSNVRVPEIFLKIALRIAEEMRLSEEQCQALHYATLLKDTAKIGIPDEILNKPAKLTCDEYKQLREHPIRGAKIVQSFESLKPVVPIILYSREKYDGTGYPKGLKGEKIPVGARILAVINAFEAILIGRPYRGRASLREALDEISKNSGSQFDPKVVETFLRVVENGHFSKALKKEIR